jgi:hypothetical protein
VKKLFEVYRTHLRLFYQEREASLLIVMVCLPEETSGLLVAGEQADHQLVRKH